MPTKKIKFSAGDETLSGTIFAKSTPAASPAKPTFLFLHGAGTSTQTRAQYLMEKLLDHEINSFGFDFSGHGESSGALQESSLQKRVNQAAAAMQFLDSHAPISVYGSSMGGHIAIRLLERFKNIQTLTLFVPGVYDGSAFEIPFTNNFSEIIRTKDSWKNSETFEILENFTGNLLIFAGEQDEVIPRELITMLDDHSPLTRKKEIVWLPNCNHAMQNHIAADPQLTQKVIQKMRDFHGGTAC